jgi:hypothetical protein
MRTVTAAGSAARWVAAGAALAATGYAASVASAWYRFGRTAPGAPEDDDPLLDTFLPEYEIVERHHVRVAASPEITLAAAGEVDLQESALVRGIFKTRALVMGAPPDVRARPRGLLAEVRALGWAQLAEIPGREVVVGAVTQPWRADVVFRPVPAPEFAAFREPGYVKIAWTLRADPAGAGESIFRTETRAFSTDAEARARFRRYWSLVSPGIVLIRLMLLGPVKAAAERRARELSRGPKLVG